MLDLIQLLAFVDMMLMDVSLRSILEITVSMQYWGKCTLEVVYGFSMHTGDMFIAGTGASSKFEGDSLRLGGIADTPTSMTANSHQVFNALHSVRAITTLFDDREPDITQACMLPISSDGLPCMGAVPNYQNVYVCAGHSCWGILCGPISGKCMAELIATGRCRTLNLSPFDPARFHSTGHDSFKR